ncbi:catalase/peroxidase HPI [Phytophthora cinnamomi]|uniref:catalase/peroxidase HPI n=1 Tax=Phytophthora cinnamomi TaxID=4785 RepID=UPI00355A6812|nr:catalase/peroxidase HPI [Phytophthora cinnamomi]
MTFTVKQTRIEPMTCNNLVNRTKRQVFAKSLKKHQQDDDLVVPATPRRFSQQKNWTVNAGVDKIISALEPVQVSYPTLSTADRIELAGHVALDDAANVTVDFMGANNGNGTEILAPREYYNTTLISVRDNIKTLRVSPYEAVDLAERAPERDVDRGTRRRRSTRRESKDVYMMDTDLALLAAPELKEAVQLFASEEGVFKYVFSSA